MAKKQYKFNPETLTYEAVAPPLRIRIYRIMRTILIGFILASLVNFLFSFFFHTPKMNRIIKQNNELTIKYSILKDKIRASTKKLEEIKHRDHNVYRQLFAVDTVTVDGTYLSYPAAKYAYLQNDRYSELMTETWVQLDAMSRLLYQTSVSLDDLQLLAKDKERMSTSVPAIWPIDQRALRGGHIGAFGGRMHPIYRRYIMHTGIDLGANMGTPIYATGNGVVIDTKPNPGGYGNQVLIDHGFGYQTRYAHMSRVDVVLGQHVVRGEKIGEVGNTGRSTGPHLHYEVIYRGTHVDPINYFRKDMSEDAFEKIIESAKATTYED